MKFTKEKFKKIIFSDKTEIFEYPFIRGNKRINVNVRKVALTDEFGETNYTLSTLNNDFLKNLSIQVGVFHDGVFKPNYGLIKEIYRNDELNLSGSDILDTAIEMLKYLDMDIAIIDDKSFLPCETDIKFIKSNRSIIQPTFHENNISLKLFRIITEGQSWYMSKGFFPPEVRIRKIIKNYGNTVGLANKYSKKLMRHPISILKKEMKLLKNALYPKLKDNTITVFYELHFNMNEGLKILDEYSNEKDTMSSFFKKLLKVDCSLVVSMLFYLFENAQYNWTTKRSLFPIKIDNKTYTLTVYNYMIYIGNIYRDTYLYLNLKL